MLEKVRPAALAAALARRADEVDAASDALCAAPLILFVLGLGLSSSRAAPTRSTPTATRCAWPLCGCCLGCRVEFALAQRALRADADNGAGVRTLERFSYGGHLEQFADSLDKRRWVWPSEIPGA